MRRSPRPVVVLCLALALAVALVSGLSDLVAALVVPVFVFAALAPVLAEPASERARLVASSACLACAGLRAPPAAPRL